MEKKWGKIVFLCACLAFSLNTLGQGGTTGTLSWTFADGTLTISGTGDMPNYSWYGSPWDTYRENITTVDIRDGVSNIGNAAFYYCRDLTSVNIPNSVTSIGSEAFYGCSSLISVNISDFVVSIGYSAFKYCSGLTSIAIPHSVTNIGGEAFYDCNSLASIEVNNANLHYSSESGVLYNKDKTTLIIYPIAKTETAFSIPGSVTSIDNFAFYLCSRLTLVNIPNSVKSVGNGAFRSCVGLISVNIPESVTSIGEGAFRACSGLTSVNIPDFVTKMEAYIFYTCLNLTSITLSKSLKSIGNYAFSGCSKLASVDLPNTLTTIGYASFEGSGLTSVTIPNSVTAIDSWAFTKCPNLTSVVFLGTVNSAGYNVFSGYSGSPKPLRVEVRSDIPFNVELGCFSIVDLEKSILIVPDGAKANYLAAPVWQDFGVIMEKSETAIPSVLAEVRTRIAGNVLYVNTPVKEKIRLYSVSGTLLYSIDKTVGEVQIPLTKIRDRILIIQGGSWVQKVYNCANSENFS